MKRTQSKTPRTSGERAVTLDPTRLDAARGGGGLDIAVRIEGPLAPWVPSQHNELLTTQ